MSNIDYKWEIIDEVPSNEQGNLERQFNQLEAIGESTPYRLNFRQLAAIGLMTAGLLFHFHERAIAPQSFPRPSIELPQTPLVPVFNESLVFNGDIHLYTYCLDNNLNTNLCIQLGDSVDTSLLRNAGAITTELIDLFGPIKNAHLKLVYDQNDADDRIRNPQIEFRHDEKNQMSGIMIAKLPDTDQDKKFFEYHISRFYVQAALERMISSEPTMTNQKRIFLFLEYLQSAEKNIPYDSTSATHGYFPMSEKQYNFLAQLHNGDIKEIAHQN
jgi:hypothetical protein